MADGRLSGANPFGDTKFSERDWAILAAVRAVADVAGRTPADVALAWVAGRAGVASTLIGASRAEQVAANVAALTLTLTPERRAALEQASAPARPGVYAIFTPAIQAAVFGGTVQGWR